MREISTVRFLRLTAEEAPAFFSLPFPSFGFKCARTREAIGESSERRDQTLAPISSLILTRVQEGKMSESEHSSVTERFQEKIHEYKGSSSSSSEDEKPILHGATSKKHLFGRKHPVHAVLGGGKTADIILWRNKHISGGILATVTVVWIFFEWMGYHLLTFICHAFMLVLGVLFLWSNAASFVNRSPPKFPEVILREDQFLSIAHSVRHEINEAFITFRYIASGKDLKKFLMMIIGLWVVSVISGWFSFLTLCYLVFLALYTLPALYDKYEDQVDAAAGKAMVQVNKQYALLDAKVLQKIPRGPFTDKKQH